MKKIFLTSFVLCFLTFVLAGCATAPGGASGRFKDSVRIGGTSYVSAESVGEAYDLDYYWDPISKKVVLSKDGKSAKMMVGSNTVLLNDSVRTIDKEIKFHQGSCVIPRTFAYKALAPFFREKRIRKEVLGRQTSALPIRNVVIDAGHGGKDPGAIGKSGLKEKDVVLDIAKQLKRELQSLGIKATLTRSNDSFVSLGQRARVTNVKEADFFISIHANASRSKWVSGVEVFYLSESIDENTRSLKAAKNYDLNLEEKISGKHTAAILWDMIYNEHRRSSIDLAGLVCFSLSRKLGQKNRGKKPARFYVLKGTNIPAILIEVGFISNAREEKRLRGFAYRGKIAQGIANGIAQYNRSFTQKRYGRN